MTSFSIIDQAVSKLAPRVVTSWRNLEGTDKICPIMDPLGSGRIDKRSWDLNRDKCKRGSHQVYVWILTLNLADSDYPRYIYLKYRGIAGIVCAYIRAGVRIVSP